MDAGAAAPPERVLLGVPRIVYGVRDDGAVELTPFPSALRACLACLGESWAYDYLMGTTGAAFRLTWAPDWRADNPALRYVDPDPAAPYRWGMESVGRAFELVHDRACFRTRTVDSLRRGVPVIAFGLVGPPEPCVVAGYDQGGEVLLGWSFFQGLPEWAAGVAFEPGGQLRVGGWPGRVEALLLIGPKGEPPAPTGACRAALERAIGIAGVEEVHPGRASGLAAYAAWADALGRDEEFATDPGGLARRFRSHCDAVDVVAEGRWYASRFLARAAEHLPFAATELFEAAGHYAAEHQLMWEVWDQVGGNDRGAERQRAFAGHAVRSRIAAIVRQARQHDAAAVDAVERALARPQRF